MFQDAQFFSCVTDGLRSEGSFVRYHYIVFAQKLVPLMQKVIAVDQLVPHVESLIDCFCWLLNRADVTLYESNKRAGKAFITTDNNDEDDGRAAVLADQGDKRETNRVVINQENEIL